MSEIKICNRCGKAKPATTEYFVSDKRLKCGIRAICKECNSEYRQENKDGIRKYYQDNKEKLLESKKQYYKNNTDKILEYKNKNYYKNRDALLMAQKEYTEKNKEKIKEYRENNKEHIAIKDRKYRQKNIKRISERERKYAAKRIKENIEIRILDRCRKRLYKAINGTAKSAPTIKLIGCTVEELLKHLESQFTDGMSWDNYGEWHIDHIIPCASFNFKNEEEQYRCFNYKNLQPLWAIDNFIKGSKMTELL